MKGPLGVAPELYKPRPVIVMSAGARTALVVPLSTVAPDKIMPFHHRIAAGTYGFLSLGDDSWVKADMIAGVSTQRLSRPRVAGQYSTVYLTTSDFRSVKAAVLSALRLGELVPHL